MRVFGSFKMRDVKLKIDVCIPTKLKDIPQAVREAIVREIPYSRIILERAYPLSKARMLLIKKAKTKWFLFVDDDIILGKDWFKRVSRYMIKNVGAIEGVDLSKINREYVKLVDTNVDCYVQHLSEKT